MIYDSPEARLCEVDLYQPFVTSYGEVGDPGTVITGDEEFTYEY